MSRGANPEPPTVDPADEGRHTPGPEALWNESWYLDLSDGDAGFGAYIRLGLYPNRSQTWMQAAFAGEGRPLVVLFDETAPELIGDVLSHDTPNWNGTFEAVEPLQTYRVRLDGTGATHTDPLAIYRQEPGEPTPISVDLTWTTVGTPYHYGFTTRYEVTCTVVGTITLGEETIEIDCIGQRDHSWGVRDWWAFGWVWSAGTFTDGSAFHAADIRFPSGSIGFGYELDAEGALIPSTETHAAETLDPEGIPTAATLGLEPGPLTLDVDLLAVAPILLVADDGRITRFPRALCRYRSADGRVGHGWTEWNQLQDS